MNNCTCKLKLKKEFSTIVESEFLSRPVDLGKISESEFEFYADIIPSAFERICTCKTLAQKIKHSTSKDL